MSSNLDVWAIQKLPQQIYNALSNIKTDNDIILYRNLRSHLQVGSQHIAHRQFDSILYSEENDLLIMLMRNGEVSIDDVIGYLQANNFRYNEITFTDLEDEYNNDYNIKEIWFVRDETVLLDAIKDSVNNHTNFGIYYPEIPGYINLSYGTNGNICYPIDTRIFKGVIDLEDKLIIFINNPKLTLTSQDIHSLFQQSNIILETRYNQEPIISTSNDKTKSLKMTY